MPETLEPNEVETTIPAPAREARRLRLWPALVIVVAHLATSLGVALFGSTNVHNGIGWAAAPILAFVLLAIWWAVASRTPLRDRFIGLVLFIAAPFAVYFSQPSGGEMLLMVAVPVFTTGWVLAFLATPRLRWAIRRWVALAVLVGATAVFSAMRVDGIRGNLLPILAWRWSSSPEQQVLDTSTFPNATAAVPAQAGPSDWPEFRGPGRDGLVPGTTFTTDWSTPPRELWRQPIGLGWSSFAVVGDYLFTQEQRGDEELVTCYRADNGQLVWGNAMDVRFKNNMGDGPRATPTFHEGRIYTLGGTGSLQCLDAATGQTLWRRDLTVDTEAKAPTWGFASSPLIAGERVIVFTAGPSGKSVAAYDRASGEPVWFAGQPAAGYSSAHLTRLGDAPQVLVASCYGLQSFAPETGTLLWEHAWEVPSTNPRVVQPLVIGIDTVLLGTNRLGTRRLRVTRDDSAWRVEEEWTAKVFRPYFCDYVLHEGFCYGFDGDRLTCMDAATGKRAWREARCGGQLLLLPDLDMLLVLTEKGKVRLIRAVPETCTEVASFQALAGKTWNHPVVANGKLFVRNAQEAACFDLSARQVTP